MCYTSFTGLFSPYHPVHSPPPVRADDIQMCIKKTKKKKTSERDTYHGRRGKARRRGGGPRQRRRGVEGPGGGGGKTSITLKPENLGGPVHARRTRETFIFFVNVVMSINIKQRRRRWRCGEPEDRRRKTKQVQFSKVNRKSRYFWPSFVDVKKERKK